MRILILFQSFQVRKTIVFLCNKRIMRKGGDLGDGKLLDKFEAKD